MSLRRVVVLHGYTAHPGKHWFGWLREQLAPLGVVTEVPALPDTEHPDAGAWTDAAVAAIGRVDADTAVVGHSLGTITAIRAVGRLLGDLPAQVNLIPLNPTQGYDGAPTRSEAARRFQDVLIHEFGIPSTVRQRRGIDIAAGCGQLAVAEK